MPQKNLRPTRRKKGDKEKKEDVPMEIVVADKQLVSPEAAVAVLTETSKKKKVAISDIAISDIDKFHDLDGLHDEINRERAFGPFDDDVDSPPRADFDEEISL